MDEPKSKVVDDDKDIIMDEPKSKVVDDDKDEVQTVVPTATAVEFDDAGDIAEVTAPATLPAGATFHAKIASGDNPKTFTVTVPEGGVVEGQKFMAPMNSNVEDDDDDEESPLKKQDSAIMIEVEAPATLPEGATFQATTSGENSQFFTVTVPEGGVIMGQRFKVPMPMDEQKMNVPIGFWKDGLFDCLHYGFCHGHYWCALIFPFVAIAQIMERMKLDFLGRPKPQADFLTFKIVVGIWLGVMLLSSVLRVTVAGGLWFHTVVVIYLILIIAMTRNAVRKEFEIPEKKCKGCEDVCCSYWCSCCTIAQMARHTGDYERYDHKCLAMNGLPDGAPECV